MPDKSKKKTKLTEKEKEKKIITSVLCIIGIPIIVLFFIYSQASLMHILVLAKTGQAAKALGLPYDKNCMPYSRRCPDGKPNENQTEQSISQVIDKRNDPKEKSSNSSKTSYSTVKNKAKTFFDINKYGLPYSLIGNVNWFIDSIGRYFRTYWTTIRYFLAKFLEGAHDALYDNDGWKNPEGRSSQLLDFGKFAVATPVVGGLIALTHTFINACSMIWSSFNDQMLFILPWLLISILLFPFLSGITSTYLSVFLLKPDALGEKVSKFKMYGKRYKLCWAALIVLLWFATISSVWKDTQYAQIAMIASGIVPGVMLLLTAIGFANSV